MGSNLVISKSKSVAMAFMAFLLSALSCSSVPITHRKQLTLIPEDQIVALSFDQYQQFLSQHKVITGTEASAKVKRVGNNIRRAVENYMHGHGRSDLLQGYKWEFNLVKDDSANAFAMPGGKVVVYTGILPIAEDDAGLATVVGHEIAHAVARHGNERMSQTLIAQLGGTALSVALSSKPQQTRDLFMAAYGMGTQVGVLLPYSRLQESEADHLGLIFMAMAGYDPHAAIAFWQRMENQAKGGSPPQFLATHPSHQTRIKDLKKEMPAAMQYYHSTEMHSLPPAGRTERPR
jgi:predicted Zn-dependent protease